MYTVLDISIAEETSPYHSNKKKEMALEPTPRRGHKLLLDNSDDDFSNVSSTQVE
jgi:hypothetical protein